MVRGDPAAYGQAHAAVYDRIYGARFDADAAVFALADAAKQGSARHGSAPGGPVLELGLGTGRLALALVAAGVQVDGVEASPAMIERFGDNPESAGVNVFRADLTDFELPRHDYAAAVCAVSTLFMLEHAAQSTCLQAVARHLRPGGQLFVEAFVPDRARFDGSGRRVEQRTDPDGRPHLVTSTHDAGRRRIDIVHTLTGDDGQAGDYAVTLHYSTPDELDTIAGAAGLRKRGRWHDWSATPANEHSHDPVSVYVRVS